MTSFAKPAVALRRDRLSDQIAQDIERRILAGELSIGEALPSERDLMVHYGVGRPAVREALLWLNKKGLLAVSNGDRTRVTEPDPKELLDLLSGAAKMLVSRPHGVRLFQQTRAFVETSVARRAALLATPEQIAELEEILTASEVESNDLAAFALHDDAFHSHLMSIVQNPLVDALYHAVLELLEEQRRISLSHPIALAAAIKAHRAIFAAIKRRDPDRAEEEMAAHLSKVEETYWTVIK
ncbi:FCD domain-containing protein [Acidisoma cellulosilytica]|uniref:FCD domain-containing protein n=1 Tax=Acidisoma cellulosilyticum TaxID=2802395 RepID=A0A964E578_9PROT|nr:FCD domain-containing protein [Acidisoma cellulosilyticum]MCB8882256.1 FCD domain-containing protein [Acidisoma cellulosilyticum]